MALVAHTSCGFRLHSIGDVECWCNPEVEASGYGPTLIIHKDVMIAPDTQPRMTCFG